MTAKKSQLYVFATRPPSGVKKLDLELLAAAAAAARECVLRFFKSVLL
jgi:hypothetical protein